MSTLLTIALEAGLPLVERVLARKIGADNAAIAGEVVRGVAERLGVPPEVAEAEAERRPDDARRALVEVEGIMPELLAVYQAEAEGNAAQMRAEQGEPLWARAWRPLGMYGLGFFWFWNVILLHVANAIWKTALPQMDLTILMELSALYMGLYMGGHTVKAMVADWAATK